MGFAIPFCILWISALLISTETYLGGFTISSVSPSGQSISYPRFLAVQSSSLFVICCISDLPGHLAVHQLIIAATCPCFFCRNSRRALNKSRCYYNHYYCGCNDIISGNVAFVDIIRRKEASSTIYKKQRETPESYKGLEKTSFTLQIIILKDKIKTIGDSKNKKRGDGCCIL